jgi:hypothetical protein
VHLLGEAGLDDEVRARIVAAAEGNPLFVEQLLSMLIDEGLIRFEDGAWRRRRRSSRSPSADDPGAARPGSTASRPTSGSHRARRVDRSSADAISYLAPEHVQVP